VKEITDSGIGWRTHLSLGNTGSLETQSTHSHSLYLDGVYGSLGQIEAFGLNGFHRDDGTDWDFFRRFHGKPPFLRILTLAKILGLKEFGEAIGYFSIGC